MLVSLHLLLKNGLKNLRLKEKNMMTGDQNSFWMGFGSVLTLGRCAEEDEEFRFTFRNVDIAHLTAAKALSEDWRRIGAAMNTAVMKRSQEEDAARR